MEINARDKGAMLRSFPLGGITRVGCCGLCTVVLLELLRLNYLRPGGRGVPCTLTGLELQDTPRL